MIHEPRAWTSPSAGPLPRAGAVAPETNARSAAPEALASSGRRAIIARRLAGPEGLRHRAASGSRGQRAARGRQQLSRLVEARRCAGTRRRRARGPRAAPGTRGRTCGRSARRARGPRCSSARSIVHSSSAIISRRLGGAVRAPVSSLEDPRVPERAAGDHHRVGARLRVGARAPPRRSRGRRRRSPGRRRRTAARPARGRGVVGAALVVDGGAARVEGDRGDAGLLDQPHGEVEPGAVARARARSAA